MVAAAGAVAGGVMANNAAKDAAGNLNNYQQLDLEKIPPPQQVDVNEIIRSAIGQNYQNLPMNLATANRVNQFNLGQFVRGANRIQPYFNQLQEQIGRNALSFSRGELPSDVVGSVGRAAASRGFAGGIGMGSRGGGFNTALGGLNLRNLGLTSLNLAQQGTQLGMSANAQAANMVPNLFDPTSMMLNPGLAVGSAFNNASILNDWNRANTAIANAEASGNTELANSILEAQTGLRLQGQLNQAQAIQSASSSLAGLGSAYAGGGGSLFGAGGGSGGGQTYAPSGSWQRNAMGASGAQSGYLF